MLWYFFLNTIIYVRLIIWIAEWKTRAVSHTIFVSEIPKWGGLSGAYSHRVRRTTSRWIYSRRLEGWIILSSLSISATLYHNMSTLRRKTALDFPEKIVSSRTGRPPETMTVPRKPLSSCIVAATPVSLNNPFKFLTSCPRSDDYPKRRS